MACEATSRNSLGLAQRNARRVSAILRNTASAPDVRRRPKASIAFRPQIFRAVLRQIAFGDAQ